MNQIVHVFKKDLRRFSWEIALSLLLVALYAWCQPASWEPATIFFMSHSQSAAFRYMGAMWLGPVLVLWWMVMLVRLIQEESPAGDRQFWVTRPYRWPSLLAAKVIFFLTMVNIPLLLVQFGLLATAGFSPFHSFPLIASIHLTVAAFLLPLGALAVIAGGRTQLSRVGIVAAIFLITWAVLGSSGTNFYADDKWTVWDWVERAIIIVIPLIVIVRQYALRNTAQARWLLLGAALVLTLVSAVEPKFTFNEAEYPLQPSGTADLAVTIQTPARSINGAYALPGILGNDSGKIWITVTMAGERVADGNIAEVRAVNFTFEATDGTRWNSGWQAAYGIIEHRDNIAVDSANGDGQSFATTLEIDKTLFDHMKSGPVTVHLATAATLLRDHTSTVAVKNGKFDVPNVGKCFASWSGFAPVSCLSAQNHIPMLGVSFPLANKCPPNPNDVAVQGTAWELGGPGRGNFGLSPVSTVMPYLMQRGSDAQALKFCPVSQLVLHQPEVGRHFRVENDFKNVKMADLQEQR